MWQWESLCNRNAGTLYYLLWATKKNCPLGLLPWEGRGRCGKAPPWPRLCPSVNHPRRERSRLCCRSTGENAYLPTPASLIFRKIGPKCLNTWRVSISQIQEVKTKTTSNDFSLIRLAKVKKPLGTLGWWGKRNRPITAAVTNGTSPGRTHWQYLENLKMHVSSALAILILEIYPTGFCSRVQTLFTLFVTAKDQLPFNRGLDVQIMVDCTPVPRTTGSRNHAVALCLLDWVIMSPSSAVQAMFYNLATW